MKYTRLLLSILFTGVFLVQGLAQDNEDLLVGSWKGSLKKSLPYYAKEDQKTLRKSAKLREAAETAYENFRMHFFYGAFVKVQPDMTREEKIEEYSWRLEGDFLLLRNEFKELEIEVLEVSENKLVLSSDYFPAKYLVLVPLVKKK